MCKKKIMSNSYKVFDGDLHGVIFVLRRHLKQLSRRIRLCHGGTSNMTQGKQ